MSGRVPKWRTATSSIVSYKLTRFTNWGEAGRADHRPSSIFDVGDGPVVEDHPGRHRPIGQVVPPVVVVGVVDDDRLRARGARAPYPPRTETSDGPWRALVLQHTA